MREEYNDKIVISNPSKDLQDKLFVLATVNAYPSKRYYTAIITDILERYFETFSEEEWETMRENARIIEGGKVKSEIPAIRSVG